MSHLPMTIDGYTAALHNAFETGNEVCWIIGDLVNYGKDNFPEKWLDICDVATGKSEGTLNNYARTCTRFPAEWRTFKHKVAFTTYMEVGQVYNDKATGKATPEALDTIEEIASENLSRDKVRSLLNERKGKKEADYTTCKITSISEILAEYFDADTSVELFIKNKTVRMNIVELEAEVKESA